jgi:hypothetical protein
MYSHWKCQESVVFFFVKKTMLQSRIILIRLQLLKDAWCGPGSVRIYYKNVHPIHNFVAAVRFKLLDQNYSQQFLLSVLPFYDPDFNVHNGFMAIRKVRYFNNNLQIYKDRASSDRVDVPIMHIIICCVSHIGQWLQLSPCTYCLPAWELLIISESLTTIHFDPIRREMKFFKHIFCTFSEVSQRVFIHI